MDKDRRPKASSDVRRASGQIAEFAMERIRYPTPQFGVQTLDHAERVRDVETGMEGLEPKVVLFVDHDADPARQIHRRARSHRLLVQPRQLLTDKVPLVEEEPVLGWQLVDAHQDAVLDGA